MVKILNSIQTHVHRQLQRLLPPSHSLRQPILKFPIEPLIRPHPIPHRLPLPPHSRHQRIHPLGLLPLLLHQMFRLAHAHRPRMAIHVLPAIFLGFEGLVQDADVGPFALDLAVPFPSLLVNRRSGKGVEVVDGAPVGDCDEGAAAAGGGHDGYGGFAEVWGGELECVESGGWSDDEWVKDGKGKRETYSPIFLGRFRILPTCLRIWWRWF